MLTFLTIENKHPKSFLPLRYKVFTELKSAEGVDVKHIRYIHKRGRIHWDKIVKLAGDECERLLTQESLIFPENCGLRRFECNELKARFCLNTVIGVLKLLKDFKGNVNVAVFDPDGTVADSAEVLLRHTQSLTVVTRMTGMYGAEAERILNESGAVLSVSKRLKSLSTAQLVIAPNKLMAQLPVEKNAVILTSSPPSVSQRCGVYYRYYFSLSEELLKLLPQGFDAEYLASALYTLLGRFDLGSIVPQAIKGEGLVHTLVSLSKYLMNIGSNT